MENPKYFPDMQLIQLLYQRQRDKPEKIEAVFVDCDYKIHLTIDMTDEEAMGWDIGGWYQFGIGGLST